MSDAEEATTVEETTVSQESPKVKVKRVNVSCLYTRIYKPDDSMTLEEKTIQLACFKESRQNLLTHLRKAKMKKALSEEHHETIRNTVDHMKTEEMDDVKEKVAKVISPETAPSAKTQIVEALLDMCTTINLAQEADKVPQKSNEDTPEQKSKKLYKLVKSRIKGRITNDKKNFHISEDEARSFNNDIRQMKTIEDLRACPYYRDYDESEQGFKGLTPEEKKKYHRVRTPEGTPTPSPLENKMKTKREELLNQLNASDDVVKKLIYQAQIDLLTEILDE